jgi:hypothetical protein
MQAGPKPKPGSGRKSAPAASPTLQNSIPQHSIPRRIAQYPPRSLESDQATCVREASVAVTIPQKPWLQKIFFWAYGKVAGFGYAPEQAFYYAAAFVLIGMIVLRATGEGKKHNMPIGLFYSFSQLIPLVSLDKKFDDIELTGITRWYFYIHKIVGYIIAIFIGAALSGLSNKN